MDKSAPWTDQHLQWLHDTGREFVTSCGRKGKIFTFTHDVSNAVVMSAWAKHFRNHYCADEEIEFLREPGQSNSEYLLSRKFPHRRRRPGPSIRAGDFAEILVADYLAYLCDYFVPRTRYDRKGIANESTKGSDVIAFKVHPRNSKKDELLIFEVKAKLTGTAKNNLQDAINDSVKDEIRLGESMNAIKQRMLDKQETQSVRLVARFQDSVESPYLRKFGAAAVCSDASYDIELLSGSDASGHPYKDELQLIAISGPDLMNLAHELYARAADEI